MHLKFFKSKLIDKYGYNYYIYKKDKSSIFSEIKKNGLEKLL